MRAIRVGLVVAGLVLLALPVAAAAAEAPKVLTVLTVRVKGDQDVYLKQVKQFNAISNRLESGGTMRVWRATAAGPNVGTIFVAIEYANLEAYAKAQTKLQGDAEWTKLRKELDTSGLREVVDSSLFVDVTP